MGGGSSFLCLSLSSFNCGCFTMSHDSAYGASLDMGFPGDAVTKSLGTILAGKAGPQGEAQDGPSNPSLQQFY